MTEERPSNRRERRIAARKEQIIDAAAQLFAEKGFHRATTRDIAEAADVSEGTLYNYFESKEDILFGIMTRLSDAKQLDQRIPRSLPEDARGFLVTMMQSNKDFIDQNHAMLQSVLSEILVDPVLRERYYQQIAMPTIHLLEQHLQARSELGQIRSLNAPLAARVLSGMMTGLYVLDVLGDPLLHSDWEELVQVVTSLLFEGVAPDNPSHASRPA